MPKPYCAATVRAHQAADYGHHMQSKHEEFLLDDDLDRLDRDAVWDFLAHTAYWGKNRTREMFDRQLASAWRVVGIYDGDGATVGFARAISDGVGLAYLADVYVLDSVRGRGLGKQLLQFMIDDGPGRNFRWMLHTSDAHGLYEKYGFGAPDQTYLERPSRQPAVRPVN
jgi:GNAT superfamily N-acetyltransferase